MLPMRLLVLSIATACILAGYRSYGQERPIPFGGDAMIEKFLDRNADLLAGRVFEAAATRAEWEAIRPRLKAELFQMLGLWPVPERTPLHARVTGTLDNAGPVVIEKIHFQSRPGLYVTGNLYRPRDVHGRLPAILYVCGHLSRGRDGNKTAFQEHGMWFARNGYVALLIDETFVDRAELSPPAPEQWQDFKARRLAALRALSFRPFPERIPPAQALLKAAGDPGKQQLWLATEPGIDVAVLDLRSEHKLAQRGTLIVLNEGESPGAIPEWARSLVGEDAVVVLAPRGVGPTAWDRKSPPNYVARSLALLGRTVDQGRVYDASAVVRWLADIPAPRRTWRIIGSRQAGIIAAYAALFEPAVAEVVVVDPLASHRDGPIFLNLLRVLDVPGALGLLAPRPLTLVGAKGEAWSLTKALYERAGAATKLDFK